MVDIDHISVLAKAPANSSQPDSISVMGDDIWVAYTNGADSTGASGNSTIVEYDRSGHIDQSYSIAGSVDGLKGDPITGQIWALQNQDGNSTLTLIDPEDHSLSQPLHYAVPSSMRGYDDVAFLNGKVYLSYTNPNTMTLGDPVLVQLTNGNDPDGLLRTSPILRFGDMGTDLETGQTKMIPVTDPDSLKVAPNGDLLLTGGSDDVIKPSASSGTFYLSDTADNGVLTFHATGLNVHDYYASVGDAFGQVDPKTGLFTPLITAANAPGMQFGSAHGAAFVADDRDDFAHGGGGFDSETALMQFSANAQNPQMPLSASDAMPSRLDGR